MLVWATKNKFLVAHSWHWATGLPLLIWTPGIAYKIMSTLVEHAHGARTKLRHCGMGVSIYR